MIKNTVNILMTWVLFKIYFKAKCWWESNTNLFFNFFCEVKVNSNFFSDNCHKTRQHISERDEGRKGLTLMLLVANLASRKWCKKLKTDWNPGMWVLIWEYSARAIQWIPTWQGLEDFQNLLHPCALDESSLSIGRVKCSSVWLLLRKLSSFLAFQWM